MIFFSALKFREKCVHNISTPDIWRRKGSYLMKFVFSFNNQSSVFLREHFQTPEAVKATFADCFKVSHISFDSLRKDYHILYFFFFFRKHPSFLQSQSVPARYLNTQSEKNTLLLQKEARRREEQKGRKKTLFMALN